MITISKDNNIKQTLPFVDFPKHTTKKLYKYTQTNKFKQCK